MFEDISSLTEHLLVFSIVLGLQISVVSWLMSCLVRRWWSLFSPQTVNRSTQNVICRLIDKKKIAAAASESGTVYFCGSQLKLWWFLTLALWCLTSVPVNLPALVRCSCQLLLLIAGRDETSPLSDWQLSSLYFHFVFREHGSFSTRCK